MRLVEQMLLDLNDAFDGDPWHGQSLKTIIDSVDPAGAWAVPCRSPSCPRDGHLGIGLDALVAARGTAAVGSAKHRY